MARSQLETQFAQLREDFACPDCDKEAASVTSPDIPNHENPMPDITRPTHPGCGYRPWQEAVKAYLIQDVGFKINHQLAAIVDQRNVQGQCHMCGVCCKLASSEFSFETLKQKAQAGDEFARQFTSIFVPYESIDDVQAEFPDLVADMLSQTELKDVHFYHCPYLGQDNRCTIYNDPRRPKICDEYPQTPLTLMYKNCGYQPWRTAQLPAMLMAHATLELCTYYVDKIDSALNAS
ncbi:MAG: YkgJ family cysteine cluster protein [Cyanobacteria bacterium HKST-UBA06]|nr:YkgJ family cysteine cluster protein [Cyanobacteria bacterium HKST-UBA04]MCA9807010.1 YkgJ family cysteine cluster protein [Cyanobacteria bacterium HKST-UBA06]MCA9842139.1 YkgJ family cysteine cluster protein [Cyanobacteria bacterium HKST-UBA03]